MTRRRPHPPSLLSRRTTLAMLSSSAVLAACGDSGGGGSSSATASGSTPTPSPTPTPTPTATPTAVGAAWYGYGHDAQHSGVSAVASQDLGRIAWTSAVDLAPAYTQYGALLTHYGSPVVTTRNTVVVPVKTTATGDYRLEGRSGVTGALTWSLATDYVTPPHNWLPPFNVLLSQQGRLYAPAGGGRLVARDDADAASSTTASLVFYGAATYAANAAAFNAAVFINTPLTADAAGNIFFGFQVTGANPAGLVGGIARVAPDGSGTWISAATASGDAAIQKAAMNCAPALSPDGTTLYIAVNIAAVSGTTQRGYLLALDSTTLAVKAKVALIDPNSRTPARVSDDGTASPVVGSDGRVYYGVLEAQFGTHNGRGWLLQFDAALNAIGAPGSFGWDVSPSIIPTASVPSYTGTSPYLLAVKYNNYEGAGTGDGLNRLAILDPRGTQADRIVASVTVMREVLTVLGPTLDAASPSGAGRREWCINTMAADPQRRSILANNEDGVLYRWDLTANTLTQSVRLNPGLGQAYTPTLVGADGAVYAISNATLYAIRA
ncbi:hypothetical protein [Sphingomonas sp.]|uniref:hypothetical protein n=1 Tax=Sphingomonas sp. TaxID=28214 RepID=UPI003CC6BDC4